MPKQTIKERVDRLKSLIHEDDVNRVQISEYWINDKRVIYSIDVSFGEN